MKLVRIAITALVVAALIIAFHSVVHAGVVETLCAPLRKFERSCEGVKTAIATLGKTRVTWLAKKCGATNFEIKEAEDCLRRDNGDKK